jgi:hypothetical protein
MSHAVQVRSTEGKPFVSFGRRTVGAKAEPMVRLRLTGKSVK